MALTIKYLLLQKSELTYEVAIRGELPLDNVEGLRRQVTKLTVMYPADEILDSVYDYPTDVKGCNNTLDKIKNNIESLINGFNESLYKRTIALSNHLFYRIQRIEKPGELHDSTLLTKIQKSFENYKAVLIGFSKEGTTDSTDPKPTTSPSEPELIDKLNMSGLNINVTCDRGATNDFTKLKYDGKSCVRAFVQKVEEFRTSKGVTDSKMLLSAIDIFSGDALHWYRSVRNQCDDWSTLILRLKDDFDIPDYDYRMLSEIRDRTQGDDESITVYLSIMEGMFSRLSRCMSDEDKLDIILHNIRPCYSVIIAASPHIKTIEDLRTVCKNYERIKVRSDNYREPPSFNSEMIAPEFCYQSQNRKVNNRCFYNNNSNANQSRSFKTDIQIKTPEYKTAAVAAPYCFRCRDSTHSMKDCPAERTIICFGCGEKGIRKPDCPKCKKATINNSSKN